MRDADRRRHRGLRRRARHRARGRNDRRVSARRVRRDVRLVAAGAGPDAAGSSGHDRAERGGVRSAKSARGATSLSAGTTTARASCGGFEYEIDGDRFLRLSREGTARWWRPWCRFPRRAASRSCAAGSTAGTPSLVAALDAAGETIDLTLALAGHLRRRDRLQHRAAARRSLRADRRKAVSRTTDAFAGYGPFSPRSSSTRDGASAPCGSRPRAARRRTSTSAACRCGDSSSRRR